jgi:hypothetical protein
MTRDRYHNLLTRLSIMTPADIICEVVGGVFFDFRVTETNWFQCSATDSNRNLLHTPHYVVKDTPEQALLWADEVVSSYIH